jgi:ABC-type dipeptide/oligopeptide/nickel transport system ATPase component
MNPFSTCNWRSGVIDYIFESDVDIGVIFERLTVAGGFGQIVGEHGTGKSTLLESIAKYAAAQKKLNVQKIILNSTRKKLPPDFLSSLQKIDANTIHILDGYEQLSLLAKIKLRLCRRRNKNKLIFTTHKPAPFVPVIYKTTANPEIFKNLVKNMIKNNNNFNINNYQINQIFKETKGNFRNGFFKLYDLFEEKLGDREYEIGSRE